MGDLVSDGLKTSPLDAEHRALGAKMGAFGGWDMPIEYSGTLSEHRAVREAVGIFDLTHLGKIDVTGAGSLSLLQRSMANDSSRVDVGAAQYNMVLNEGGGIVDDLINYRVDDGRWLLAPNASNTEAVLQALRAAAGSATEAVEVVHRPDLCLIAPQGPRSFDLVGQIFPQAPSLDYMHAAEMTYRGERMLVARSGYTGERGFELFVPEALAVELWRELLSLGEPLGIQPCGLGARDTLRLEMGYPLHGNDIGPDRTPFEAGLSWAVALEKRADFPGRDALIHQKERGIPSRLWGLRMKDRLIPRSHYPVLADGQRVGETTSGTFSPTLRVGIAMGYLAPRDRFSAGDGVEIDVRGRVGTAEVMKTPFVPSSPR